MRITTHIPDSIAKDVKIFAENEKKSVSAVVSEAIRHYIVEKKKKELGMKVLNMAGKVRISGSIYDDIKRERKDPDDRP